MDIHPVSRRNAVISAANLLMVSLLKLNRVFVPASLRWLRSRRRNWIRRSSLDIARELAASPERRRLCVGSCCGGAYGSIMATLGTQMEVSKAVRSGKTSTGATVGTTDMTGTTRTDSGGWVEAASSEYGTWIENVARTTTAMTPSTAPRPSSSSSTTATDKETEIEASYPKVITHESGRMFFPMPPGWGEDEVYYRLRVLEEERHRANQMKPVVYSTVLYVYFTLFTLILYGAVIITVVLTMFTFQAWEAVVFSFTLFATAVISEAETLMQTGKRFRIPPILPLKNSKGEKNNASKKEVPKSGMALGDDNRAQTDDTVSGGSANGASPLTPAVDIAPVDSRQGGSSAPTPPPQRSTVGNAAASGNADKED